MATARTAQLAREYEVVWPGGDLFANRYSEAVFTLAAAEQASTRIGGTIRLAGTETPKES
jgi:hypothetical protein